MVELLSTLINHLASDDFIHASVHHQVLEQAIAVVGKTQESLLVALGIHIDIVGFLSTFPLLVCHLGDLKAKFPDCVQD